MDPHAYGRAPHPAGAENVHATGYRHHYQGEQMRPDAFPPPGEEPDFRTPGQLVRHWLVFLLVSSVIFWPLLAIYAWLEDADPWMLAVIFVLASGLLVVTEAKNVLHTLAGGADRVRLWAAMLVTVVLSAAWGVGALVVLSHVFDTGENVAIAAMMDDPAGLASVFTWAAGSCWLGWISAAMLGWGEGRSHNGQMAAGLLLVVPILVMIGLAIWYLFLPEPAHPAITLIALGANVLLAVLLLAILLGAKPGEPGRGTDRVGQR